MCAEVFHSHSKCITHRVFGETKSGELRAILFIETRARVIAFLFVKEALQMRFCKAFRLRYCSRHTIIRESVTYLLIAFCKDSNQISHTTIDVFKHSADIHGSEKALAVNGGCEFQRIITRA